MNSCATGYTGENLTESKMSITPKIITGPEFKKLREATPKISVYALVKAAKVSRQQINRFESGQNDIRLSTLTKLLTALYGLKSNDNV